MIYEPRKLKALRLGKKWSQKELSRRAGVSQPTISGLERGMPHTKMVTLFSVAVALGVPLSEIMSKRQPSGTEETRELEQAMMIFESLSPAMRRAWIAAGAAMGNSKGGKQ